MDIEFIKNKVDEHDHALHDIELSLKKNEELRIIDGDHMSYIRKDLTEVKDMMTDHIKRVEPVINAYEEERAGREYLDKQGKKVIRWAGLVGAMSVIGSSLIWTIKKLL